METFNDKNLKGFLFTTLDLKDIEQAVGKSLIKDSDLTVFISKETAHNGVKQFLQIGLGIVEDFDKTADFDKIFNVPLTPVASKYIMSDFRKRTKAVLPASVWTTSFKSRKEINALKRRIVDTLYKTIKGFLFDIKMKCLMLRKLPQAGGTEDIIFDTKITVGDFTSEDKITSALEKLTALIDSFKTPSLKHTKFSSDNLNLRLKGQFYLDDFVMVWNLKYKNRIRKHLANLYNWEKVIETGLKEQTYDFDKLDISNFDSTAINANEKARIGKQVAFLIHKNALVQIFPTGGEEFMWEYRNQHDNSSVTVLNTIYGFGRLPWYPVAEIISE